MLVHALVVVFMVGEHTQSGEKVVSDSVKVKVVPHIDTAYQNVLHLAEDCLLHLLVGISRTNDFFLAEQVENAVAAGLHLRCFAQVL